LQLQTSRKTNGCILSIKSIPQDHEAHRGAKLSLRDDLVQATSSVKTEVAWDVVLRLTLVAKKDGGIPGEDRDGKNAKPAAKWGVKKRSLQNRN
jgi:hypothetical protein